MNILEEKHSRTLEGKSIKLKNNKENFLFPFLTMCQIDPIAVVANFVDIDDDDDDDDSEKIEGLQYQLKELSKKVEELFSENQKLRDEICAIEERHKEEICAIEERHKKVICAIEERHKKNMLAIEKRIHGGEHIMQKFYNWIFERKRWVGF